MKTRCPVCGATFSLDVLIANDDARDAIGSIWKVSDDLGRAVLRYAALFRPAERELTLTRLAKLLGELVPDIQAQQITRGGVTYPAPPAAWISAIDQSLSARDSGRLQLPLKTHGYLYEIISGWQGDSALARTDASSARREKSGVPVVISKTRQAAGSLIERANAVRNRDS